MKEENNISAGLDGKLNKSASLDHFIRGFINMRRGETDSNDTLKLCFENIYETMDLTGRYNILRSKQPTKNGNQASTKNEQPQMDQMKAM